MTSRLLLIVIFAAVPNAVCQDSKASDDDWTETRLREDIAARLKNGPKGPRSDVVRVIGAEYAASPPSETFVKSAISLFRSSTQNYWIRAVVLASLNTPSKEAKAAIPFLHVALSDPKAVNRLIAIDVIANVDAGSEATLKDLIEKAYMDPDNDVRQAALEKVTQSLQSSSAPPTVDALEETLRLIHNLQQTIIDKTDRQTLAKLSVAVSSLVQRQTPTPPPIRKKAPWLEAVTTIYTDRRFLVGFAFMGLFLFLVLCVQLYYIGLYFVAPLKLYSLAHADSPFFVLPYVLAPTAYRYSRRPIAALLKRFNEEEDSAEGERLRILAERLQNLPERNKRSLIRQFTESIQNASERKARDFYGLLRKVAPTEAMTIMDLIPRDPEIVMAREQMRSILQTPQETIVKKGLTLDHELRPSTTISGDFYNIIPRGDGSLGIYTVDVIGHGLPASLLALQIYVVLRTAEPQWGMGRPRHELATADDLMRRLAGDFAVCMSFLEIDLAGGFARYASAGMPPALLFPKGQSLPVELLAAGPYVGRGYKFSDTEPSEPAHKISEGDIIVLYSDGITEATNTAGKLFGTNGLVAAVQSVQSRESKAVRDSVMNACARFSEKVQPDDDQSLIVIQIGEASAKSQSAEGPVLRESSNEKDRIVVSLLNNGHCGAAVMDFFATYLEPFAIGHGFDMDSVQRIRGAITEALINCIRHGTPRGKYLEIRISSLPDECLEVELIQTNEWVNWDQMLGRHRSEEIDKRFAAFRRGETPDLQYLGTQLVVAHSSEIECSPDGRRQRIRFCRKV